MKPSIFNDFRTSVKMIQVGRDVGADSLLMKQQIYKSILINFNKNLGKMDTKEPGVKVCVEVQTNDPNSNQS
jgi:hypothetical protein